MCRFKLDGEIKTALKTRFNTSYVSVQAQEEKEHIKQASGFNTSYVSVQEN